MERMRWEGLGVEQFVLDPDKQLIALGFSHGPEGSGGF